MAKKINVNELIRNMHFLKFALSLNVLFFVCFEVGCNGKSVESYRPSNEAARKAIETALSTWKSGTAHGSITNVKPTLDVFDARWQAGAKLESYEILEEITGKPEPHFNVKLKLAGKAEETTEYLVVGIDPLLIFRQADYAKTTGM